MAERRQKSMFSQSLSNTEQGRADRFCVSSAMEKRKHRQSSAGERHRRLLLLRHYCSA